MNIVIVIILSIIAALLSIWIIYDILRNKAFRREDGIGLLGVLVTAITIFTTLPSASPQLTPTPTPTKTSIPRSTETSTVTPTFSPTPTPIPTRAPTVYEVQKGDTLLGIAQKFDVTPEQILEANGLNIDSFFLTVGQQLIIPSPKNDRNISPPN